MHYSCRSTLSLTIAIVVVLGGNVSSATADDALQPHELELIEMRILALGNIKVHYNSNLELTPPSTPIRAPQNGPRARAILRKGMFKSVCQFERADKAVTIYTTETSQETLDRLAKEGDPDPVAWEQTTFRDQVAVTSRRMANGARVISTDRAAVLPQTSKIDLALGLRLHGENTWIDSDRIKTARISRQKNLVVLIIDGQNGQSHELAFDSTAKMALTWLGLRYEDNLLLEIVCEDFREVGGVPIPRACVCYSYYYFDGKRGNSRTEKLSIGDCLIGAEDPTIQPK